ncbi:hypothetical protein [Poriferisphaera sp. WC338]|uniref:hypothetical protein n=1 Tax=Poriferisphaera sp. WC338 TaxID=3425129 RepID=UPI003D81470A
MKSSIFDKIKTIFAVSLITVLVWLWAEGRNVDDYTSEAITVRFVTPGREDLRVEPETDTVKINYRASVDQYDRLEEYLKQRHAIDIDVAENLNGDDRAVVGVSFKARLASDSIFSELGISVESVKPESALVTVEKLVTRSVPLKVELGNGDVQIAQAQVVPETVEVQVPASLVEKLNNLALPVSLHESDLANVKANEAESVQVAVELPKWLRDEGAEPKPRSVQVNFILKNQRESYVVRTVPINIMVPASVLERYEFVLPEDKWVIPDVEVQGPADAIEKIRKGEIKLTAVVRPTLSELGAGEMQLPVDILKPDDVQVVSTLPNLTVQVRARNEASETAAGGGF